MNTTPHSYRSGNYRRWVNACIVLIFNNLEMLFKKLENGFPAFSNRPDQAGNTCFGLPFTVIEYLTNGARRFK
ncbi:MAG: hypothetical protein IPL27_08785 [Lewinellaceae bacterium]|nr:hypothetical protein [Lewinellaceae bacterium]